MVWIINNTHLERTPRPLQIYLQSGEFTMAFDRAWDGISYDESWTRFSMHSSWGSGGIYTVVLQLDIESEHGEFIADVGHNEDHVQFMCTEVACVDNRWLPTPNSVRLNCGCGGARSGYSALQTLFDRIHIDAASLPCGYARGPPSCVYTQHRAMVHWEHPNQSWFTLQI